MSSNDDIKCYKLKLMNCLVTGGSGYLGSALIKYISPKFNNVSNFDTNKNNNQDGIFIKGDILNFDQILKASKNIDIIYHCIAKVPITKNSDEFIKVNENGTENLLKAAQINNVKKIIFVSSSAVFGIPKKVPIMEEDERHPVEKYGLSKKKGEDLCFKYMKMGLDITIVRPRTILGHNRLGIFSILFEWVEKNQKLPVLNNGDNFYQFVDIEDLVNAIYKSSLLKGSNVFNIGAEKFDSIKNTLNSLIEKVESKSQIKNINQNIMFKLLTVLCKINFIPLQDYHLKVYGESVYFDISKSKKILNWTPKYSSQESMIKSYESYITQKKNGALSNNSSPHNSILKKGLLKYAQFFI